MVKSFIDIKIVGMLIPLIILLKFSICTIQFVNTSKNIFPFNYDRGFTLINDSLKKLDINWLTVKVIVSLFIYSVLVILDAK